MNGPVPKLWPGCTVAILAGGPSLRTLDIDSLKGVKILTINDSWRMLPATRIYSSKPFNCLQCSCLQCSDGRTLIDCSLCCGTGRCSSCAMYFCDESWWRMQLDMNRRTVNNACSFHDALYKGWWFSGAPAFVEHPQVHALRLTGQTGLELDPSGLRHGSNSGYQAINLAVHLGAKKIILLGYDMKTNGARTHWHDESRPPSNVFAYTLSQVLLPHYSSLVKPLKQLGISVINATPDSALNAFPKATLEEALGAS